MCLFIALNSYSQKEKLLGKWQIVLCSEADVDTEIENDAKLNFLSNQTVIIVDDSKKFILNWELKDGFLFFKCDNKTDYPRFCDTNFKITMNENNSVLVLTLELPGKSYTRSFTLNKVNSR